ncbi:protein TolR [Pararhodospirillum photometricum]|uniref:Biopolymer transport protein ExbD/TolR n=1 Tax=Pararhodospirillum photometricum DSM 122 TaxID=1150469 RepID=H6SK82_PARPM|nr:protein TolR [Pararhodospirillum photometricum]CCG08397.1 Biopolymer transport protein ExbD/TolR [Pararhodospirillum photometricum DSM 122]
MGASIAPRRGGHSRRRRSHQMSDINVTPMVDVMLVLLIIFMVTAPLMTTGVKVDLPRASTASLGKDTEALTVSVTAEGAIYLQDQAMPDTALAPRLQAITQANPDVKIYVRGDAGVNYGRVMEVMGLLRQGGLEKVALITQPGQPAPQTPTKTRR